MIKEKANKKIDDLTNDQANTKSSDKANGKSDREGRKRGKAVRLIVMIAVLATSTVLGLLHQFVPGATVVGVDALCPFGGIEAAYNLLTTGSFVQRIALSSLILLAGVLIVAILFRRSFCGLVCPLGTIQELSARLGIKIFGRRLQVPKAIDKPARYLKYVVLALTIFFTVKTAELVIRPYDPWVTYHHLFSSELFAEFLIGFIVLAVTIVGSFTYDRFFCKYACPMGAFLGLISRFSVFKVRRNATTCASCKSCDKACPVNIKVSEQVVVKSAECIDCAECVNACPSKGTLSISTSNGSKLSPLKTLGAVVAIFAVVIGATTIVGSFEWTTKSLVQEIKEKGEFDTGQIKGRMTIHEVSEATGIPGHAFREKFKLSESDMSAQIKTLEGKSGVSAEDVRMFVGEYLSK